MIPEGGEVSIGPAGKSDAVHADEIWKPLRPSGDANILWDWTEILEVTRERFAIRFESAKPVGLWAAKGVIKVVEFGALYRLDFLEIDPRLRKGTLGAFALAAASMRAQELGCAGLAIPSLPETCKVYERLGAIAGVPGWNVSPALAPYRMINGPFRRLLELAHEYEKEI